MPIPDVPSYDIVKKRFEDLEEKVDSHIVLKVITDANAAITATCAGQPTKTVTANASGIALIYGLPIGTTWDVTASGTTESVKILGNYQEVSVFKTLIYGYRILESNSTPSARVEYTDDAVGIQPANGHSLGGWANTPLFASIKPVVRYADGTFKDLNKRDLTRCTDGSASNVSSLGNDMLTEFPTWWVHEHKEGSYKYIKLANKQVDDSYSAMHAMDNGVLRDEIHIACNGGYMSGNKIYSSAGKTPSRSITYQDFITYCKARGKGFCEWTWLPWNYLCYLFTLAYKSTDSQTALGKGNVNGGSVQAETRTSYDNDFGLAGSTSTSEQMSFLWINNLWGNMYQFVAGAKTNSNNQLMVILDGKDPSVNESDFTTVGSGGNTSGFGGYISEMTLSDPKVGHFPKVTSGSSTTHWCDNGYARPSYFPRVGGGYSDGVSAGLFNVRFNVSATGSDSYCGSRLMYKGGR